MQQHNLNSSCLQDTGFHLFSAVPLRVRDSCEWTSSRHNSGPARLQENEQFVWANGNLLLQAGRWAVGIALSAVNAYVCLDASRRCQRNKSVQPVGLVLLQPRRREKCVVLPQTWNWERFGARGFQAEVTSHHENKTKAARSWAVANDRCLFQFTHGCW